MNYGVYKSARNASWQCFIDCGISTLPIKPIQIAKYYGIICKRMPSEKLNGHSAELKRLLGQLYILYNTDDMLARQRFSIMHELGHYLLGHLGEKPLARSESACKPEEEKAADKFAIDMLAPACVLWGLGLHTPEEIARVCNISMQAAQIRAERMETLYQRNMFLSHSLERVVFHQFKPWIDRQKYFYK